MEKTNERKLKKKLAPDHRKVKKGMKKTLARLLRHLSNRKLGACND